eukprot:GHVU01036731.1.p2 GENE.GHVU01036731.1~~GHVU01036731.1.p2  ORF type:complete len:100 (-),score=22.05 GHVU01036731.1:18-317(-)
MLSCTYAGGWVAGGAAVSTSSPILFPLPPPLLPSSSSYCRVFASSSAASSSSQLFPSHCFDRCRQEELNNMGFERPAAQQGIGAFPLHPGQSVSESVSD